MALVLFCLTTPAVGQEKSGAPAEQTGVVGEAIWLRCDDTGTTTTLRDSTGQSQQTLLGGSTVDRCTTSGLVGKALILGGACGFVEVRSPVLPSALAAERDFTIAFWWKSLADARKEGPSLRPIGVSGGKLAIELRQAATGALRMVTRTEGGETAREHAWELPRAKDGAWHHYAIRREGCDIRVFEDAVAGELDRSAANTGNATGDAIRICAPSDGGRSVPCGVLDDFRLYAFALTDGEIQRLFDGGNGEPGPIVRTVLSEAAVLAAISASADLVALAKLQRQAEITGPLSGALEDAFAKRQAALVQSVKNRRAIGQEVDLLAFGVECIGEKRFRATWVVVPTKPISADCTIMLYGYLEPEYRKYLSPQGLKKELLEIWNAPLAPPTSTWQPRVPRVIYSDFDMQQCPYVLKTGMQVDGVAKVVLDLGWYVGWD